MTPFRLLLAIMLMPFINLYRREKCFPKAARDLASITADYYGALSNVPPEENGWKQLG